jgi:bacterioferritin
MVEVGLSGYDRAMDKDGFVDALNEDLKTEFRSIVQYVQHIAIIKGAEFMSTVDELRLHVAQELNHALVLAEQIEFLGGVPTTDVSPVEAETDSRRALQADLRLETEQLSRYRDRTAQALELTLADVAEALRPLLEQTQEHVRDLRAVLGE